MSVVQNIIQGVLRESQRINVEAQSLHTEVTNGVVLALSNAWIGISTVNPKHGGVAAAGFVNAPSLGVLNFKHGFDIKRDDFASLYSLQIGDYFMPLSQTFVLCAVVNCFQNECKSSAIEFILLPRCRLIYPNLYL